MAPGPVVQRDRRPIGRYQVFLRAAPPVMEHFVGGFNSPSPTTAESHGNEVLNLVLARGYLTKLFSNARVIRYLEQHSDLLSELQAIVEGVSLQK